jgi:hypothetical protein
MTGSRGSQAGKDRQERPAVYVGGQGRKAGYAAGQTSRTGRILKEVELKGLASPSENFK